MSYSMESLPGAPARYILKNMLYKISQNIYSRKNEMTD